MHSNPSQIVTLAVGGRFHSEFLAEAIRSLGFECELWTSFPKSRFKEDLRAQVHSLVFPEVVFRLARKVGLENVGDIYKIRSFGRQLARSLQNQKTTRDIFICWSSFGLETLKAGLFSQTNIIRDSAHIEFQMDVLNKEYSLFGKKMPDRSAIVEREIEEYRLADKVIVLSQFAKKTFLERGIPENKLQILRLGVDTKRFVPSDRKFTGGKLRVVYFGALSVRKGVHYLLDACQGLKNIELTLIGDVEDVLETRLAQAVSEGVHYHRALPQSEVAKKIAEQDMFIMPTLEDGFGQTVVQAMAAGLVPISTDRCGASERIQEAVTGFKIPASDATAMREILIKMQRSPSKLEEMRSQVLQSRQLLSWDTYRQDVQSWLKKSPDTLSK